MRVIIEQNDVRIDRNLVSYSKIPIPQAQKRLGFNIRDLTEVPVRQMVQVVDWPGRARVKDLVFEGAIRFLRVSGSHSVTYVPLVLLNN